MSEQDDKPERMPLGDVSNYRFGSRFAHYLTQYGGKDAHRRAEIMDIAYQEAVGEMLDEHHSMLIAICEKLGIEGGWND